MASTAFKILCGCIVLVFGIVDSAMARSTSEADKSIALLQQHLCRDDCSKKFAMDDMSCLQQPDCSMCWDECTASTSINKSILDTWSLTVQSMVRDNSLVSTNIAWAATNAPSDCLVTWEVSGGGLIGNLLTQSSNVELSLWPETKYRIQVTCKNKCWDECTASTSINKSILDTWSLTVQSMVRDNSLVSTNIAWAATNAPSDCLVTWEVSGGGLIGNLLTQSSNVELSLWPETKYRIQVTCKNKQTEEISRSLPLTLDTNKAVVMVRVPTASTSILSDIDDTASQDQSIILRDSSNRNGITSTSFNDNESNDDDRFYERIHFDEASFESTLAQSSLLVWATYENHKELVLGAAVAFSVFLTVILAFLVNRRKSRATIDKAPLVDNEVCVNVDVDRLTIHV